VAGCDWVMGWLVYLNVCFDGTQLIKHGKGSVVEVVGLFG